MSQMADQKSAKKVVTILLADDAPTIPAQLKHYLKTKLPKYLSEQKIALNIQLEFRLAFSAKQLYEAISSEVDIVITDNDMPKSGEGENTVQAAKKSGQLLAQPVYLCSSHGLHNESNRGLFTDIFGKPLKPENYVSLFKQIVAIAQQKLNVEISSQTLSESETQTSPSSRSSKGTPSSSASYAQGFLSPTSIGKSESKTSAKSDGSSPITPPPDLAASPAPMLPPATLSVGQPTEHIMKAAAKADNQEATPTETEEAKKRTLSGTAKDAT